MLTKVFRSLVIAAIFAAMGCSNQAPNHSESGGNKILDSYPTKATTVYSQVVLEDSRQIGTTLSNRRVKSDGSEVSFHVKTDSPIEGRTEFVMALFGHDLGNGRYSAGYRVEDLRGYELWRLELAAEVEDMSWVELSLSNDQHSCTFAVENVADQVRHSYSFDGVSTNLDDAESLSSMAQPGTRSHDELHTTFGENTAKLVSDVSGLGNAVLTDKVLLEWVNIGSTQDLDPDGPQLDSNIPKLICNLISTIEAEVCDEQSSIYDARACSILAAAHAICDVLKAFHMI